MPNGTVKFFNAAKGFGFITSDEGGKELFVPTASLTPAGISSLKTGQRVSFEVKPDSKGPKAVGITLLANPPPPRLLEKTPDPAPQGEGKKGMTFYHDPANDESCNALGRLRASGHEPRVVEYLTAPPSREELKSLSLLLRANDQSLVRKYDALFLELCLDDRFISETEFWGAIFEHPSLINGPVVATETKASLCRSDKDVKNFLAAISSDWIPTVPKRKVLPEGILRMMMGNHSQPPAEKEKAVEPEKKKPAEEAARTTNIVKAVAVQTERKPKKSVKPEKPKLEPTPKLTLKTAVKTKNKPVTKPVAAKAKKSAAGKPARKSVRA
jgi:arsenate reductase